MCCAEELVAWKAARVRCSCKISFQLKKKHELKFVIVASHLPEGDFVACAGYVQGMSDLLAPILEVVGNEVDAFWCFVGFMNIVVSCAL